MNQNNTTSAWGNGRSRIQLVRPLVAFSFVISHSKYGVGFVVDLCHEAKALNKEHEAVDR